MSDTFLPGSGFDTYESQDKVLVQMDGSRECAVAVRILQQQGFAVMGAVVRLCTDDPVVDAAKEAAKAPAAQPAAQPAAPVQQAAAAPAPQVEEGIPGDVIAAIMAAIHAMGNGKYTLKAVRRSKNGWGNAGVNDTTAPF